ncbi:MAG TPA: class I SAM-dependent methyltransferase [Candidatus Angelobacter sp.]|nr:class I SAM-dependent methyltransferase [Candidatus Angelobacter sp.]
MNDTVLKAPNVDPKTVKGFGQEWSTFSQERLSDAEREEVFRKYFCLIDWSKKPLRALDMGCGSGRWDILVAPLVVELVAADASPEALSVAKRNVQAANVSFVEATPDALPFPDGHFDFIFSLGVLHHVPDTQGAIRTLATKLSSGGVLLLYLYYAFDHRPGWFKALWRVTDWCRRLVSRLPFPLRYAFSQVVAVCVYWPLARIAKYLPVPESWPLKFYADRSFYFMKTDALDRFGTKLEKRFTRMQISQMLESAGLVDIRFSDSTPYWVCAAKKP